jgi:hypothetical protein
MVKFSILCAVIIILGSIASMFEKPAQDALKGATQEKIEALDNLE